MHPLLVESFKELTQVDRYKVYGKMKTVRTRIYVARGYQSKEYRYHIEYVHRFKELLTVYNIHPDEIEYLDTPMYTPYTYPTPYSIPHIDIRDYQQEAKDYILEDGYRKLITLQTGRGKTYTALEAAATLNQRIMVIILGRYREKWVQDVKDHYGDNTDVYLIPSAKSLLTIALLAKQGKKIPDILIVTNGVMKLYIEEWETSKDTQNPDMIPPEDLYGILGIGYRIIDEAHQHFHAVFKIDLYTHCPKTVYLTGTLDTNDRFTSYLYRLMWPTNMRSRELKPIKYDQTFALFYQHERPETIRCVSNRGYSHALYEQSIWRHVPSRCQYLDMVGDIVEQNYLNIRKPGRRLLIFFSLINTCIDVVHYLNIRFKDLNLKISKYTTGDNKEIIDTSDITVSTLGKAGTALDVSGLVTCIMMVALAEPKANKQAKGRLRDLSRKTGFEDVTPRFLYGVGTDIPKHVEYHRSKIMLFEPYTTLHQTMMTGYRIGMPMNEYLRSGREERWEAWKAKPRR